MSIIVNLDVMMAKRKMSLNELSERVGITTANLSILKTGKARAIRMSTLNAICKALSSLVNFCNEQAFFNKGKLKFSKKMPLNIIEQESNYKTKFIFKNNHKIGVDYK